MDMEMFVRECRECDPCDTQKVSELLDYAAQLGEAILSAKQKREQLPYEQVRQMYNNICTGLPKACKLTNERKRHIKACFGQKFTLADFERAFDKAQNTPFLRGENERGWTASFDWLIKPANLIKVLEGCYGTTAAKAAGSPSFDLDLIMDHAKYNKPQI